MPSEAKLGKILDGNEGKDAVHVAIVPVITAHNMVPGQRVGIKQTNVGIIADSAIRPFVGIIDPFLEDCVEKGQHCYLCLFPNTVTSLRHVWTHPNFPDAYSRLRSDTQTGKAGG